MRFFVYLGFLFWSGCAEQRIPQDNFLQVTRNDSSKEGERAFVIRVYGRIGVEDTMDCFFVMDSLNEPFTEKHKFRVAIKGKDSLQEIEFIIPESGRPLRFRIDLGRNNSRTGMEIHKIEMEYRAKIIRVPGILIPYFFDANEYIEYGENGRELKFRTYKQRFNPYLASSALLNKKMKIEF